MAKVYINKETNAASMLNPETLDYEWIPREQIAAKLGDGWLAEDPKDYKDRYLSESYDAPVRAAAAGVARGLTLGLSDLALTKGGFVTPEELKLTKEGSPLASGVGDIVGTIGGALIPGGPLLQATKGAAKVGTGAARLTAKLAQKHVTTNLPRLAKGLATGSVEGAAIGTGHAISEKAMNPEMSAAEFAKRIAKSTAFGAGFGAAGYVGGVVAKKVKSRWDPDIKAILKLRDERRVIDAKIKSTLAQGAKSPEAIGFEAQLSKINESIRIDQAAVKAAEAKFGAIPVTSVFRRSLPPVAPDLEQKLAQRATIQQQLKTAIEQGTGETAYLYNQFAAVNAALKAKQTGALNLVARRAMAYGIGHVLGGGVLPGLVSLIAGPLVLNRAKKLLIPLATSARGKIAGAVGAKIASVPGITTKVAGKVQGAVSKRLGPQAGAAVADFVDQAGAAVGSMGLKAVALGSDLSAGGLAAAVVGQKAKAKIGEAIAPILASGRVGGLAALSDDKLIEYAMGLEELEHSDIETHFQMMAPQNTDPAVIDSVVQKNIMIVDMIKQAKPKDVPAVLKAIDDPGTVIKDISEGRYIPAALKTVKAVYGDAWRAMQASIAADYEEAKANGAKFSTQQLRALSRLLENPSIRPPIDDPKLFIRLQGNFTREKEQTKGPRMSRKVSNLALQEQTRLQRSLEGRT
jgi:hypothetical protein